MNDGQRRGPFAGLLLALVLCAACKGGDPGEPDAAPNEAPEPVSETVAAFDYPGGWRDATSCVDICGVTPDSPVDRPPAVRCFDPADQDCDRKTGDDDYDYLLLSQHWLPSFCAGLAAGYDTTVTHRDGARCRDGTPSRLTIHGLWPNYTAGFPQCCGDSQPLDPQKVPAWPEPLREGLAADWLDPTTDFDDGICEMLNHEWQKHGTCMAAPNDAGVQAYFTRGLEVADRVADATRTIDGWAGTTVARARIVELYPKSIQVVCDAKHPERLVEIRTCWSRALDPIDCSPAHAFGQLTPCGDRVTLPASEQNRDAPTQTRRSSS